MILGRFGHQQDIFCGSKKMLRNRHRFLLHLVLVIVTFCFIKCSYGQNFSFRPKSYYVPSTTPLPFRPCRADDIECLRKGLRTFFFLMDSGHLGMSPVDPMLVSSVTVSLPEQQMSLHMRRINVTGSRWTKLIARKFNLPNGKSGVKFLSDLHVTAEITLSQASRFEPLFGIITMDIHEAGSNVTYNWYGERGYDNEDYIGIGVERIAVRNTRTPTFFMQPVNDETTVIETLLNYKPSLLEHLSNEITSAVMHNIVDNFRIFASKVPVKYYYKYLTY